MDIMIFIKGDLRMAAKNIWNNKSIRQQSHYMTQHHYTWWY